MEIHRLNIWVVRSSNPANRFLNSEFAMNFYQQNYQQKLYNMPVSGCGGRIRTYDLQVMSLPIKTNAP